MMTPFLLNTATSPLPELPAYPLAAAPAYTALVMLILGALVWTSGRRLVKLSAVICGLVLGALGGAALGQVVSGSEYAIWWMAACGVAGAAVALLLLRLWIGLSTAVMLAVLGPLIWLVWNGATLPQGLEAPGEPQVAEVEGEGENGGDEADSPRVPGTPVPPTLDDIRARLPDLNRGSFVGELKLSFEDQEAQVRNWWDELSESARTRLVTISLIGAAAGLALGLLAYVTMGTFQTSLVGSVLLLGGYERLTIALAESMPLPVAHDGRIRMAIVLVLSVVGMALQMRLWSKSSRR
ncbi:MAG: hypothetical protein JJU36_05885 [Phycisphaeraceae bacterium]|nr:hypothetical protein [Phycisphaeraceae bacterium]